MLLTTLFATVASAQTYAALQTVAVEVRSPNPVALNRWVPQLTESLSRAEYRQRDGVVTVTMQTCDLSTTPAFGAATHYSPALVSSIGQVVYTGTRRDSALRLGPAHIALGASVSDQPLTAGQAIDADGDGHPGVTVQVEQSTMGRGEVYVAQRSTSQLDLVADGDGWTGTVSSQADELVLDASAWWLKSERPKRAHSDPTASRAVWVAIDDDMTCDGIIAQRATLFSAREAR